MYLRFLINNYITFGKERGPSFESSWIPFIKGWIESSLVEIGHVVLEKKILEKMKMWKVYDNDDNDDDDGQRTNGDQKSSLEPSAQMG